MRIRSKLTLSFGLLFGLALVSLGALFYRTFEQTIEPGRQQLFALRSQAIAATLDFQLHEAIETAQLFSVRHPLPDSGDATQPATLDMEMLRARAADLIAAAPIIEALYLIDSQGRTRLQAGAPPITAPHDIGPTVGLAGRPDAFSRVPEIRSNNGQIDLFLPALGSEGPPPTWVFRVDRDVLALRLRDYFRRNDPEAGSVTILDQDGVVLRLEKGGEEGLDQPDLQRLGAALSDAFAEAVPHIEYRGSHLFPARVEKLPWRVVYRIPGGRYWYGIPELRLELVTLLLAILSLAVYVIYVLSLRITRPIQELQNASRVSIELNYEQPIRAPRGTDEIGDLARTFEIQRRRIGRLINRDELTGTYNRRYFMLALNREVARAQRKGETLCVMMIDADHFKSINDEHGHACGDAVLAQLGRALTVAVRPYDIVGRLGGEEFAICAPGATLEAASQLAERIRVDVEQQQCQCGNRCFGFTVSIGLAEHAGTLEAGADALLHRADEALYQAKRRGRNRVEIAAQPKPPSTLN